MIKYVRTKTKIEVFGTSLRSNKEFFDYLKQFDNYKDDLIKVADTVKELCDCVVENRINVSDELPFIVPIYQLDEYKKLEQFGGNVRSKIKRTVVCCIWVIDNDIPTLKPIAKMNDEGDLILL